VAEWTGPISKTLTEELEALKLRLAGMSATDIPGEQAAALAQEIGGIRLQLKRLRAEQAALARELERRRLHG
jgi:hypothetical protein